MRTLLLAALALAAPLAAATIPTIVITNDPEQDAYYCTAIYVIAEADPQPCAPIATITTDSATYYLVGGPTGLYQESNGCPGFQHEPGVCAADGLYHGRDPWVAGH